MLQPITTTTYVLSGTKGALSQTLSVTVEVDETANVAMVATPPFSDGSVPVEICWKSPLATSERTVGSLSTLSTDGTLVTHASSDFSTSALFGGELQFTLKSPLFTDVSSPVTSLDSATELTLSTPIATTLAPGLTPLTASRIRCYEAYGPTAFSIGLPDSR